MYLGDCHTWNPFNLKGNRENQQFVDLHDAILQENGGAWDDPPDSVCWSAEHTRRARELLAGYGAMPMAGFKDPRMLLVLEGWKAVTDRLEFVGIFRHPEAVAESLKRRSQKERKEAFALWYVYNSALYREFQRRPFPLLCFDDPGDVFQAKLRELIGRIGLNSADANLNFYDSELKNYNSKAGFRLPWRVRRLYNRLRVESL